ncbi:hypothetical protein WME94_22415 [Sorangium sp. So ce429]
MEVQSDGIAQAHGDGVAQAQGDGIAQAQSDGAAQDRSGDAGGSIHAPGRRERRRFTRARTGSG